MSLLNTRIQNVRANSRLDKNESRPSRYGALDVFQTMSEDPAGILSPELKDKAAASIGNVLEVPVIDYDGGVSIGNVRSVTIPDDENVSQMHQITFATYAWGFTSVPSNFMNNEVSMQADFARKFEKYLFKLGAVLDSAAVAALGVAKSQVFTDPLQYTVTANTIVADLADKDNLIGDVNPIMAANDHFGGLHLVGNGGLESLVNKLAQKGVYNSENKQLEYLDKILHYTSRISNAGGEQANFFGIEQGALGILTRFEREALLNASTPDGHEWGIDTLPMLNFPVGTYFYESVGDVSGMGAHVADNTRARKEHYGFAVDVAFITPYNSDPSNIANPIMKFTINTT